MSIRERPFRRDQPSIPFSLSSISPGLHVERIQSPLCRAGSNTTHWTATGISGNASMRKLSSMKGIRAMETGGMNTPQESVAKDFPLSYSYGAIGQCVCYSRRVDDLKKDEGDLFPKLVGEVPGAPDIPEEDFCKVWKPEPITEAEINPFRFRFSFGLTLPPRKPDDEPLQ